MAKKQSQFKFNDFFAVFFMFMYMVWIIVALVALINVELTGLQEMGLTSVTVSFTLMVVLIVQYYFRKAPPKDS